MKKSIALLLSVLMLFALSACGSSAPKATGGAQSANSYVSMDTAYAEETEAYWDEDGYGLSPAEVPMAAQNSTTDGALGSDAPAERPDKIIYSANVQVETTDFDLSLQKLQELIERCDGWVESSSINGNNYHDSSRGYVSRRSASYTLRIPSQRFDELMSSFSDLGNVPFTHTYTENVTAQYYDVQARLTAYEAQEQRLLEMMELAETVEDIIVLEDRLTEVRYSIESLQSSLKNWDRQVSYSSIYLDLTEVQEYTPEPYVQPSFGQQLLAALQSGLRGAGSFFKGLALWLAEALPTLLVLGALTVLIVVLCKKGARKRKARQADAYARRMAQAAPVSPAAPAAVEKAEAPAQAEKAPAPEAAPEGEPADAPKA